MRSVLILMALGSLACVCGGKPPPVPPPPSDAGTGTPARLEECARAEAVTVDQVVELTGSRLGEGGEFRGSNFPVCTDGDGEDKIYKLEFPRDTEVYMHLETGGWPILQLRKDCAAGPDLACGNKQVGLFSTTPAEFTLKVDAGTYYAIVDSERDGDAAYTFTIRPEWTAEKQQKCEAAEVITFDAGRWSKSGDTTGQSRLFLGSYAGACDDGRAAEDVYRLELPGPTRLTGTISTQTDWGIMDVKPSCFTFSSVGCANEWKSFFGGKVKGRFDVLIDGGSYVVVVDSEFDAGVYSAGLSATAYTPVSGGHSCGDPIVLPGAGKYAGPLLADGGNTVALSCGSDAGLPEAHFRIDLPLAARLSVNVFGGFTPQVVALRSGCPGAELQCTDTNFSGLVLDAGTYYLALEIGTQPYSRDFWLEVDVFDLGLDGGSSSDAGVACTPACATGSFCLNGLCQSCVGANRCGASCTPCPAATPYCNAAGNGCVACLVSGQCPALSPCCTSANVCQTNLVGCQ